MATSFTGLISDQSEAALTQFHGFSERTYVDMLQGGYGFIFITAPSLFIDQIANGNIPFSNIAYNNLKKDPRTAKYIQTEQFGKSDADIVKMLSYNTTYNSTGFVPIFTNMCKGIDPTEITLDGMDAFQTTHGYKQTIATNSIMSKAGSQINIPFQETADLSITKIIDLWCSYIENVSDGTVTPHPNSITNGAIDYLSDIYYIMLSPDGQTIKYYVRWTGCYPTNIPYSRFNYQRGDRNLIDIDISFNCIGGIEHMNPAILEEFNMASLCMRSVDISADADNNNNSDYFKIKDSSLLSPTKLNVTSHQLSSKMKNNPLIFCLEDSVNSKSRFVLTFGPDSYELDNNVYMLKEAKISNMENIMSDSDLMFGTPYSTSNKTTNGTSSIGTGNPSNFRELI